MELSKSLRYEGPLILLWRGLVKVAAPLGTLKLLTLCEKDLEQPLVEARAQVDITISRASQSDADTIISTAIAGQDPSAFPRERRRAMRDVLLGYFRRGGICFIATIDRKIVHSNWIHFPRGGPIMVTHHRYLVL